MTWGYDPRGPEQGIVVIGGLGDAVCRVCADQGVVVMRRWQVAGTEQAVGFTDPVVRRHGYNVVRAGACPRLNRAGQVVEGDRDRRGC